MKCGGRRMYPTSKKYPTLKRWREARRALTVERDKIVTKMDHCWRQGLGQVRSKKDARRMLRENDELLAKHREILAIIAEIDHVIMVKEAGNRLVAWARKPS